MGIWSKIMDSVRINSDVDDDYEYEEYEEYEEKPQRSFFKKDKGDDYRDEEQVEAKPRLFSRNNKVTPVRRNMEVALVRPTSFEEAREVCDYLLSGKAVVLNMEGIHTDLAQRIIDFTSGATYSMEGNMQKISNYIFIVTPSSVELSGDFMNLTGELQNFMGNNNFDSLGAGIRRNYELQR